ncbi:MAG: Zn-dependent exopeptidase M28 [Ruminococcaceae bacterium]|nr:Zn-dependent exopeptidase M28 [Oscillospiraceae bacterium]
MNDLSPAVTELIDNHPYRYSQSQKSEFLLDTKRMLRAAGYNSDRIEEQRLGGIFGSRNLIIGNPEAEYLVTAHYDTPGRNGFLLGTSPLVGQTGANIIMLLLLIPFFIAEMWLISSVLDQPEPSVLAVIGAILAPVVVLILLMLVPMLIVNRHNSNDNSSGVMCVLQCALYAAEHPELADRCCFVLFDNEEWGLVGSIGFVSRQKKRKIDTGKQFAINLDCVGVGEVLAAVTTVAPGERCKTLTDSLSRLGLPVECKRSQLVFMSDHAAFPDAVMLSYMNRSKLGPLYIPNIHSRKDTQCDNRLVAELAEHLWGYLCKTV